MRVLVCGGRSYRSKQFVHDVLMDLHSRSPIDLIIHGGASGVDKYANDWSLEVGIPRMVFLAQWEKYGKQAGPIRNDQMLREGKPDLVVSFPGGRGTSDMMNKARLAKIPIATFSHEVDGL